MLSLPINAMVVSPFIQMFFDIFSSVFYDFEHAGPINILLESYIIISFGGRVLINSLVSLILVSTYSLQVYRSALDFYLLTQYSVILINSFISSRAFYTFFDIFCVYNNVIWKWEQFLSSPICTSFFSFMPYCTRQHC